MISCTCYDVWSSPLNRVVLVVLAFAVEDVDVRFLLRMKIEAGVEVVVDVLNLDVDEKSNGSSIEEMR